MKLFCRKSQADYLCRAALWNDIKTANRTLDIHNLIEREIYYTNEKERAVSEILSRSFMREAARYSAKFMLSAHGKMKTWISGIRRMKKAVEEWAEKNQKPAGRGTDTLREARAIYLPVITQNGIAVVSFSCAHSKLSVTEHLIFGQIESLLRLNFIIIIFSI